MTESTPSVELLRRLPPFERLPALTSQVVGEFRSALQMDDDEPLPLDASLFLMGLSSLLLVETKVRLETLFDIDLSATVLLNSCTVGQVVDYLSSEVLAGIFQAPRPPVRQVVPMPTHMLWDEMLESHGSVAESA